MSFLDGPRSLDDDVNPESKSMSTKGWVLLHDEICPPYWDKHYEIKLSLPFKMVKF